MIFNCFRYSLLLLLFNKYIVIKNPLFSMGFFNFYQSTIIYPFFIVSILSSLILIIERREKIKKQNIKILILSFLILSLFNSIFIPALLVTLAILSLTKLEKKQVIETLSLGLMISIAIGVYQVLTYSSFGLQKIGETNISKNIPGLSKINVYGTELIRSYGVMAHPNILAGFIAILTPLRYANIFTFSVAGALAHINWWKLKAKSFYPLIILLAIKNPFLNKTSYLERINEYQSSIVTNDFHNIYLQLFNNNLIFLIAYLFIIKEITKRSKKQQRDY